MKTHSIDFTNQIPADVIEFHKNFKEAGKDLFMVGGCVRDLVHDHLPWSRVIGHRSNIKDFDMVTDALPEEIETILKGYELDFQGKHFGVMRVNTPSCKKGYEIATYREDITPGRKPVVRVGSTMEKDSMRRDFTINSLYYDIENQIVLDPTDHGLEDLLQGVIHTPGKPEDRMNEDKLRVLRAVRFSCRIEKGTLSPELREAIKKDCKLEGPDEHGDIVPISRERIVEEFLKGIEQAGENSQRRSYVMALHDLGLLDQIFEGLINKDSEKLISFSSITSSESTETTVAIILSNITTKDVTASINVMRTMVDKLEFPGELSAGVKMLLDMRCVSSDTAYALRKYMNRTGLTIKDIREFAIKYPNHPNMTAFAAYVTLKNDLKNLGMENNTGDQLMKEGFKAGPEMGVEQAKREADSFTKILDYMVQNDVKNVYPGITQYHK